MKSEIEKNIMYSMKFINDNNNKLITNNQEKENTDFSTVRTETKLLNNDLNKGNSIKNENQNENTKRIKLANFGNISPQNKTRKSSLFGTFRKSQMFQTQNENDSSLDSIDIENLKIKNSNGSETIIRRKQKYFKKIKKNNEKIKKQIELQERIKEFMEFFINILSNFLNLISVGIYILQTIYEKEKNLEVIKVLNRLELIFSFYFIVEMVIFFINSKSKSDFIFSINFLIDLITIIPPFLTQFVDNITFNLSYLRVFRMFRVFRILRIYKTIKKIINDSYDNNEDEMIIYNPVKLQVINSIVVLIVNIFIGAGLILGLQEIIGDEAFSVDRMHFFDALYFTIITSTTIGYGDIIPSHPITRMFSIFGLFYLIVIVGNQINKLGELMQIWGEEDIITDFKMHYIIICDDTIKLKNVLCQLKILDEEEKIIVISTSIKKFSNNEYPFDKVVLMNTENIDFDILNRSNSQFAKGIFIYTEKSNFDSSIKEKLTDLLILKITRYMKNIPIYVQTLYNESNVVGLNKQNAKQKSESDENDMDSKNNEEDNNNESTSIIYENTLDLKYSLNYKKISKKNIPIMKLKTFMLAKSLENPGFLTFSQNLIFEDNSLSEFKSTSNIIKPYLYGITNKIRLSKLPQIFIGKEFTDVVYNLYFRSIQEIFTKIKIRDGKIIKPILLIGLLDLEKLHNDIEDDPYMIFPVGFTIRKWMAGIFICSDQSGNYLSSFLEYFDRYKSNEENKTDVNLDKVNEINEENNGQKNILDLNDLRRNAAKIENPHVVNKTYERRKTNAAIREKFDRSAKINKTLIVSDDDYQLKNKIKEESDILRNNLKSISQKNKKHFTQNIKKINLDSKPSFMMAEINDEKNAKEINHSKSNPKRKKMNTTIEKENVFNKLKSKDVIIENNKEIFSKRMSFDNNITKKEELNTEKIIDKIDNDEDDIRRNSQKRLSVSNMGEHKAYNLLKNKFGRMSFMGSNLHEIKEEDAKNDNSSHEEENLSNENLEISNSEKEKNNVSIKVNENVLLNNKSEPRKSVLKKPDLSVLSNNRRTSLFGNKNKQLVFGFENSNVDNNDRRISKILIEESENRLNQLSEEEKNNLMNKNIQFLKQLANNEDKDNSNQTSLRNTKISIINDKNIEDPYLDLKGYNNFDIEKIISTNMNSKEFEYNETSKNEKQDQYKFKFDPKLSIINFKDRTESTSSLNNIFSNTFNNTESKSNLSNLKPRRTSSLKDIRNIYKLNKVKDEKEDNLNKSFNEVSYDLSKFCDSFNLKNSKLEFKNKSFFNKMNNEEETNQSNYFENTINNLNKNDYNFLDYLGNNEIDNNKINEKNINISYTDINENQEVKEISGLEKFRKYHLPLLDNKIRKNKEKKSTIKSTNSKVSKKMNLFGKKTIASDLETDTKKNLHMIDMLENSKRFDLSKVLLKQSIDLYLNTYDDDDNQNITNDINYERKIINLNKVNLDNINSDHIVIIGIQDSIPKLVRLLDMMYVKIKICLIIPNSITAQNHMGFLVKLLRTYSNLYIYIGESQNPIHLYNSGLNNAKMIILLTQTLDNITGEDMKNIISFKSIDYFFNTDYIIELWNKESVKLLGYQPLDRDNAITSEYLHPLYMSGRVLYLDTFDVLTAKYMKNEFEYEVWSRLMYLGYDSVSNNLGFQPKLNAKKKLGFPIIITIDIPEFYYEKDYHELVSDLLALEDPAIALGLYIEDPLLYINLKFEGGIIIEEKSQEIAITLSQKNKLKNNYQMDLLQKKYFDSLKLLKEISFTDKTVMDVVDIDWNYLPVFITNPPADFKLLTGIKVQVLCFFEPNIKNATINLKLEEIRKTRNRFMNNVQSGNFSKLSASQNRLSNYINALKKKCFKTSEFTDYQNLFEFKSDI